MPHKIILQNLQKICTREELSTSEREVGTKFLAQLDLEWGGYQIIEGRGVKAASWVVPFSKLNQAIDFVETNVLDGYEAILMVDIEDSKGIWRQVRFA